MALAKECVRDPLPVPLSRTAGACVSLTFTIQTFTTHVPRSNSCQRDMKVTTTWRSSESECSYLYSLVSAPEMYRSC